MANKADTDLLGTLHGKVAQAMLDSLEASDTAELLLTKDRDVELPDDVVEFLEKLSVTNPSLLTAAVKFLKDNKITAEPSSEENDKQSRLEKMLNDKRKRVGVLRPIEDE